MSSTLPKTNIAPENRPKPKRKGSYSNHQFSGAENVSFRGSTLYIFFPVFFLKAEVVKPLVGLEVAFRTKKPFFFDESTW